jgi:hypothetical protein
MASFNRPGCDLPSVADEEQGTEDALRAVLWELTYEADLRLEFQALASGHETKTVTGKVGERLGPPPRESPERLPTPACLWAVRRFALCRRMGKRGRRSTASAMPAFS